MEPQPVHAVRRRAEGSVVVGPEGVVVVVVVMAVVALVARGPHRGECNDGPVQIDRDTGRGTTACSEAARKGRTADRRAFVDWALCLRLPPTPAGATGSA